MGSRLDTTGNFQFRSLQWNWEVFSILFQGKSALDTDLGLLSYQIYEQSDAERFLEFYGFSVEDPIEQAELLGNFREALSFIKRYFLYPENPEGLKIEIPRKLYEISDVRDLLLLASLKYPGQTEDTQGVLLRNWSCSALKVMHAITHMDKDLRSFYHSEIQKQILDRFYKVVFRDQEQNLYMGRRAEDPERIDLVAFETKPKKSRDSTLLKLLHKPGNVAEEIFDRIGIRFITKTRVDAIRVVKFLVDRMVVMPVNTTPVRARNTLFDFDHLQSLYESHYPGYRDGKIEAEKFFEELEKMKFPEGVEKKAENLHSSKYYKSIQFTCRQLIKIRLPFYDEIRDLKNLSKNFQSKKENDEDLSHVVKISDRIDMKYIPRETRFFFPFEVQLYDEKSAEENSIGLSSHTEYKKSQVLTAMKRVMGPLFDAK